MKRITFTVKNIKLFFFVGVLCAFFMVATQVQGSWTSGGPNQTLISGLAVDPTSSDTVFATLSGGESSLATTTNGGNSWDYLVDSPTNLGSIAVDPQIPSTIFVGEGTGYQRDVYIYKSTDGGQSWTGTALFHLFETITVGVSDIWIDPSDSNIIFAAVRGGTDFVAMDGGGVYRSTDGGEKWYRSPVWLTIQSVTTLAYDPKDPQYLYYGTSAAGYVYRQTYGGTGWTRISPGGEWVSSVRDIEVDLNSHVYAATSEGLMKREGSDWTELTGLPTDDIRSLVIDRSSSPGIVYVGTGEDGVFISQDGGNTWTSFNEGLRNLSITKLAISDSLPKILYAGTADGVWRTSLPNATVTGTLTLPADASGKEYFIIIDSDTDGDNGYVNATIGTCGSGTTVDYSISNVPAGTYYVYAGVRIVSDHDSSPQNGDYIGFYGTGSDPPDEANAVVPSSGTVTFDITLSIMGETLLTPAGGGGGGGCFIATATYGSYMEPHVKVLRDFRDQFLLTNTVAKSFVQLYYINSPPVADFIVSHDTVRLVVRWSLLPFVGVSWMALKLGLIPTLTIILLMLILINISVVALFKRIRMRTNRT